MALQVIGAGFGRTGTLSLKEALEQLGFSKCHHMREVATSSVQLKAWHAIAQGGAADWDALFEGFAASCDWPSATYWESLIAHYPDAKVVLTARDPDRWYDSVLETIYPASTEIPIWLRAMVPRLRRFAELARANIWQGTFDGRFEDRAHAIGIFQRNAARVKEVVPQERLLVFQATDGWGPLCAFLDVPVPEGPYPHVNEAAGIKRAVRVVRGLRWLPLALVVPIALWLLASGAR